jgi:hypothetical protein
MLSGVLCGGGKSLKERLFGECSVGIDRLQTDGEIRRGIVQRVKEGVVRHGDLFRRGRRGECEIAIGVLYTWIGMLLTSEKEMKHHAFPTGL